MLCSNLRASYRHTPLLGSWLKALATLTMPRAAKTRSNLSNIASNSYTKPYTKLVQQEANDKNTKATAKSSPKKPRTGKDSHLYTDDNPSTTLHGTGFKDASTAKNTISLVANRSLLYQWQTINTMYHRAKHHPAIKSSIGMQDAMAVFREWLDEVYPQAKKEEADLGFGKVMSKDIVSAFLPILNQRVLDNNLKINDAAKSEEEDKRDQDKWKMFDEEITSWSQKYTALPPKKRLANVLMDDSRPEDADMARYRIDALKKLHAEEVKRQEFGKYGTVAVEGLTKWTLRCFALAYNPTGWSDSQVEKLVKG